MVSNKGTVAGIDRFATMNRWDDLWERAYGLDMQSRLSEATIRASGNSPPSANEATKPSA